MDGEAQVGVRHAVAEDMPVICEIVNYFIKNSWVNFRTRPQTSQEWTSDWERHRERYPWLVATRQDEVIGVAYAAPFKPREAYDWCVEVTVYVSHEIHRRGVGKTLYRHLIPILQDQGYRTMVAVIGLPNPNSVALHEAFGFEHAGTLRRVGYKFDEWHDVGFWQRTVVSDGGRPLPIRPLAGLRP
ncbi:MAG: GNAT family N-acetyltransferase [Isosphaeraceae bacterium]|nr:GNAT family N-acetyltransferase [Isosphaeraceae bacterium]